jgi:hypothetical protein
MQYTENHIAYAPNYISMWVQNEYSIYCKCNQRPTNILSFEHIQLFIH